MSTIRSVFERHAKDGLIKSPLYPLIRKVIEDNFPNFISAKVDTLAIVHYSYARNQGSYNFATLYQFEKYSSGAEAKIKNWVRCGVSADLFTKYWKIYLDTH